jgi:protein-S-isoprenylcysteine O-methyltransferase Ste14
MHGTSESSVLQKSFLTFVHLLALAVSAWILFGAGQLFVQDIFGVPEINAQLVVRVVIFSCGTIYFLRLCITSFVLLKRKMAWNEMMTVGLLVVFVQIFFAILTIYHKDLFKPLDWLWIGLYVIGSFLNTGSEWQRRIWKKDTSNTGKLYTGGLFKYSMHINYFGDSLLFTGFALLTGSLWALIIPLFMTTGFIFMHIPVLDRYLREKYKDQFDLYSEKTRKFIPWIY